MSKIFSITLLLITLFLTLSVYLKPGVPYTHDGENHLARFANYKIAVREGQIPPRFAPNLFGGMGYPVFNYNYPLANVLSLPLSILNLKYTTTFKILATLAIVSGVLGIFTWVKLSGHKTWPAAMSAAIVGSSSYVLNLVWVRGSIGEMMAFAIWPWLPALWYWWQKPSGSKRDRFWQKSQTYVWEACFVFLNSLLLTTLLLAHNLLGLAGFGLYLLWLALQAWQQQTANHPWWQQILAFFHKQDRPVRLGLLSAIFAIGLSAWFWWPAMLEKNEIVLADSPISQQLINHTITLPQLIIGKQQFGYSIKGEIDTLNFSLGISVLAGLVICSFWQLQDFLAERKKNKLLTPINIWLLLAWILLALQLPIWIPLWQWLPLAGYLQFAWRLSWLVLLMAPVWLAAVLSNGGKWLKISFLVLLFAQLLVASRLKPADIINRENIDLDLYSQSTSTNNENLPKTWTLDTIPSWQPTPAVEPSTDSLVVEKWTGSHRVYSIDIASASTIIEPTMYFVGWQTTANNQLVAYENSSTIGGRIAFNLAKPGKYKIESKFIQQTWPRLLANTTSIISAAVLFTYVAYQIRKN